MLRVIESVEEKLTVSFSSLCRSALPRIDKTRRNYFFIKQL
jgi:hypothetical protein